MVTMKTLLSTLFLVLTCLVTWAEGPIPVTVKQVNGEWTFMRNGEPYYVKGVGGHVQLDEAEACGANSIRTWHIDNAKEILDDAHSRGMTVMMGYWLGHERHGYDYSDKWAVQDQFNSIKKAVEDLKDHPALLCWGVGNEMDLFYSDFNVWDAVEEIAAMIHEVDPNHPTCVVTAGIDVAEVQMIKERAPSIDILGVNTYGDVGNVPRSIDLFGWEGPYMITEWGPNGHWEVAKTSWGAPVEQTSSEKAASYKERYETYIAGDREQCIGSYVFLWGQKQETTQTWYGVFLEDGSRTEAIDVLYHAWTKAPPENSCPHITSVTLDGKTAYESVKLSPGQRTKAGLVVNDPDNDALTVKWELLPESTDIKAGGDVEEKPEAIPAKVIDSGNGEGIFRAPRNRGAYRLFVFIHDGKGHAATANIPFFVE